MIVSGQMTVRASTARGLCFSLSPFPLPLTHDSGLVVAGTTRVISGSAQDLQGIRGKSSCVWEVMWCIVCTLIPIILPWVFFLSLLDALLLSLPLWPVSLEYLSFLLY